MYCTMTTLLLLGVRSRNNGQALERVHKMFRDQAGSVCDVIKHFCGFITRLFRQTQPKFLSKKKEEMEKINLSVRN